MYSADVLSCYRWLTCWYFVLGLFNSVYALRNTDGRHCATHVYRGIKGQGVHLTNSRKQIHGLQQQVKKNNGKKKKKTLASVTYPSCRDVAKTDQPKEPRKARPEPDITTRHLGDFIDPHKQSSGSSPTTNSGSLYSFVSPTHPNARVLLTFATGDNLNIWAGPPPPPHPACFAIAR